MIDATGLRDKTKQFLEQFVGVAWFILICIKGNGNMCNTPIYDMTTTILYYQIEVAKLKMVQYICFSRWKQKFEFNECQCKLKYIAMVFGKRMGYMGLTFQTRLADYWKKIKILTHMFRSKGFTVLNGMNSCQGFTV